MLSCESDMVPEKMKTAEEMKAAAEVQPPTKSINETKVSEEVTVAVITKKESKKTVLLEGMERLLEDEGRG